MSVPARSTTQREGSAPRRRFGRAHEKPASKRLRVLGVDAQEVVHWGFRTLLTSEPWVERYLAAETAAQALDLARRYEPNVALLDHGFGGELCTGLRREAPGISVLLVSDEGAISARAARSVGAFGVIPKSWSIHDIAGAVRMVGLGMTLFPPDAKQAGILSAREFEVLELMAKGATNREIAAALYISPHTVKDHTSSVYRKMHARNRAEATLMAQRLGLLV